MGLSNFHSAAAEGVLPVLVMNTVLSVALLKNMAKSLLQVVGASSSSSSSLNLDNEDSNEEMGNHGRERRISITQFKSLCQENNYSTSSSSSSSSPCEEGLVPVPDSGACSGSSSSSNNSMECCVCLCGFEADEEVSELSCKHFFHKGCLEKWFGNNHTTCPLCRSIC